MELCYLTRENRRLIHACMHAWHAKWDGRKRKLIPLISQYCRSSSIKDDVLSFTPQCFLYSSFYDNCLLIQEVHRMNFECIFFVWHINKYSNDSSITDFYLSSSLRKDLGWDWDGVWGEIEMVQRHPSSVISMNLEKHVKSCCWGICKEVPPAGKMYYNATRITCTSRYRSLFIRGRFPRHQLYRPCWERL